MWMTEEGSLLTRWVSPSQSNRQVSRDFSHVYSQGARRAKVSARGPADSDNLC